MGVMEEMAWLMAQLVKCLPCKKGDMKAGIVLCACGSLRARGENW